jgi:hypothetical protein
MCRTASDSAITGMGGNDSGVHYRSMSPKNLCRRESARGEQPRNRDRSACDHVGVGQSRDQPKLRPGYSETSSTLHYVVTDADGFPSESDDGVVRALCGAYITAVEPQRSILRSGGEPCVHCNTQFRKRGLGPA